jgi:predicted permease
VTCPDSDIRGPESNACCFAFAIKDSKLAWNGSCRLNYLMRTLLEDVRWGWRVFRGSAGLTLTAILTLALGIAANTVVFGWIDRVLLDPIPGVLRPSELATLETLTPTGELQNSAYRDYRDYRDGMQQVSGLAASLLNAFTIGSEENPRLLWGEFVSPNYFSVLGVNAIRGRTFAPGEGSDAPGGAPVVVISHGLWQSAFHGDPDVVGKTLRVNRRELTVVGVVPPEFYGTVPGLRLGMWVPISLAPEMNGQSNWLLNNRNARQVWITARLRPGSSIEQARAEAAAYARHIAEANPWTNRAFSATVLPIWRGHSGFQQILRNPLQILLAVSLLLFLIVGANVAGLQIARSAARQKEFSIRLALGARPRRLVRQLLTESLLLSVAGAAGGAILSLWGREALVWLLPPTNLPVELGSGKNWHILTCVMLLCVAAAILTGIAPALQSLRTGVSENLKQNSRGATSGTGTRRMRSILVISEVALATVAVVSTGAAVRSFYHDRALALGMDVQNVACAKYYVETFCRTREERRQFCARLADRLREAPGVAAVSYSNFIPLEFGEADGEEQIAVEGYAPARNEVMRVGNSSVSPGYFNVLGIPIIEGREFRQQDDAGTAPVMIVNQTFARRYFGARTALGHSVRMYGRSFNVIGVAQDSRYHRITEGPTAFFYIAARQNLGDEFWVAFFVRTAEPLEALALGREAAAINAATRASSFVPYQDTIAATVFPQRVAATLAGVVGAICLALSAIGLYSVLAFSVAQRTSEFGIRIALGAQPEDVLSAVLKHGMALTSAGLAAGVLAAAAVLKLSSAVLPGLSADAWLIFAGSIGLLSVVGLLASLLPARRAIKIDPVLALRQE